MFHWLLGELLTDQLDLWCSQVSLFGKWTEGGRKTEDLLSYSQRNCTHWHCLPTPRDRSHPPWQDRSWKDNSIHSFPERSILESIHQFSMHLPQNISCKAGFSQWLTGSQFRSQFQRPGQQNGESVAERYVKNKWRIFTRKHFIISTFL